MGFIELSFPRSVRKQIASRQHKSHDKKKTGKRARAIARVSIIWLVDTSATPSNFAANQQDNKN